MSVTGKQRQIKEIVRCGKDPVYFCNKYLKIQHPTRGLIPFATYPFQDECLNDFSTHRFNIILKSRQLGISTLTAAYAIWLTIFHKDKNVLIIATKLAVAQNFIKKVKVAIRSMPKWLLMPEITGNNKQTIEFGNGSQIKAIPTSDDAGRSEALSLLIVDEAAFVRNFDTLWTSLYPTLTTGGRAIVLSTPNGVGGQYYDLWLQAENNINEFNPIRLPWDVHPEHDNEWFEKECRNFTKRQIAQELLCDFSSSAETFLTSEDIEHLSFCVTSPIEKWGPGQNVWVWKYSLTGNDYVIAADVSRGDAADYSAFHVIDTTKSEVVCEFKGKIPPDQFAILLCEVGGRYDNALLCPENNTYGYAVIMKLRELGYKNLYFKNEKDRFNALYGTTPLDLHKIGFTTSGQSRSKILTKLEQVIRNKNIRVYSARLYEEFKTFVWNHSKAQAMKGKNDDLVISLAIGIWLYDAENITHVTNIDLNKAMLQGFGVNSDDYKLVPDNMHYMSKNIYKNNIPITGTPQQDQGVSGSMTSDFDFSWLL